MKAAQVVLILSFSVFKLATCWSCYTCNQINNAEETIACRQFDSSAITVDNCDLRDDMINVGCITAELTDGNQGQYFRDCATYKNTKVTCSDIEAEYKPKNVTLSSCKICNSDLCNSATIPGAFSWILVLIFILCSYI